MLGIQKILFASDLGNNSLRAMEHAKLFVSRFESELHVARHSKCAVLIVPSRES